MQLHTFRGKNRYIDVDVDGVRYIYHGTTIVMIYVNGHIRLDSGNFRSPTTKNAMNQAANQDNLGFQVVADGGEWFVVWKGKQLPFMDGMVLR